MTRDWILSKEVVNNAEAINRPQSTQATNASSFVPFQWNSYEKSDIKQSTNSQTTKTPPSKPSNYLESFTPQWNPSNTGKINDGVIAQNGNVIKIDNQDQILAAKEGGPVDKMLDTAQTAYSELPRENPYADNTNNGGKIEVAPIEIQLNGNIQLSGGNGTVDITSQIINDPIVMREITQIISKNIEMQINGGRVSNAFT